MLIVSITNKDTKKGDRPMSNINSSYNEHAIIYSGALVIIFQTTAVAVPYMVMSFSEHIYRRIVIYCAGLSFCQDHQTALGISRELGGCSHDALTRMLNSNTWTSGQLMIFCFQLAMSVATGSPGLSWLILDDVILPKKNTKKIIAAHWDHDYVNGKNIPCVRVVVLCWTNGIIKIPVSFLLWHKKNSIYLEENNKKYRTKNELARIMVYLASRNNLRFDYLLFDSWYAGAEHLKWYHEHGILFVTAIKNNRKVRLLDVPLDMKPKRIHKKTPVWVEKSPKQFAGEHPHSRDYHYYSAIKSRTRRWEVTMKGFPGFLSLICIKNYVKNPAFKNMVKPVDKKQRDPNKYLLTNDPTLTVVEIVKWYRRRWAIEVLFRDCKQNLGFNACQAQSVRAHEHHIACVFFSYILLEKLKTSIPSSEKKAKTPTIGQVKEWIRKQAIIVEKKFPTQKQMPYKQVDKFSENELIQLLKNLENALVTGKSDTLNL